MKIGFITEGVKKIGFVNIYLADYTLELKEAFVSSDYKTAYNYKLLDESIRVVELDENDIPIRIISSDDKENRK